MRRYPLPVIYPRQLGFASYTESSRTIADVLACSYMTAHLLTGSTTQAERAVARAIDLWNPADESQDELYEITVETALPLPTMPPDRDSKEESAGRAYLPAELRAVLRLPTVLRRCFVLRMLVGYSSEVCARMLRSSVRQTDRFSLIAAELLSLDHHGGERPSLRT